MVGTHDKKQRIIADLGGVRIQVQDQMLLLRRKLNVGRHLLESIRSHPWEWTSLAAGFGWRDRLGPDPRHPANHVAALPQHG